MERLDMREVLAAWVAADPRRRGRVGARVEPGPSRRASLKVSRTTCREAVGLALLAGSGSAARAARQLPVMSAGPTER
jgi:hypothetical protein